MDNDQIGKWAFLLGMIIAVVVGIGINFVYSGFILVVLGLIVGFLNISEKKVVEFLVATIALLVAGTASISVLTIVPTIGDWVVNIIGNIIAFVAPAALVVALQEVYNLAKK